MNKKLGTELVLKRYYELSRRAHGPRLVNETTYINEHGVNVVIRRTGRFFCRWYGVRASDGEIVLEREGQPEGYFSEVFEAANDPFDVPVICLNCEFYDPGELGDFGENLGGPVCEKAVYWPVKKGTCKRRRPATYDPCVRFAWIK